MWVDALTNYISALGYGNDGDDYSNWWLGGGERVHVIGKGILHFHAVYWPALLASAGEPLPTAVFVHDYLTVDGAKISKSAGNAASPSGTVARHGADALRWWFGREVPRAGDTDFTDDRLVKRANADLANGFGNLVNRTVTLLTRQRGGTVPAVPVDAGGPAGPATDLPATVDAALARFAIRDAAAAIGEVIAAANRYIQQQRPWELAATDDARFDTVMATLIDVLRVVAAEIRPFTPELAATALRQLGDGAGRVPPPSVIFPRLDGSSTMWPIDEVPRV